MNITLKNSFQRNEQQIKDEINAYDRVKSHSSRQRKVGCHANCFTEGRVANE